jgi:hypothetical protein
MFEHPTKKYQIVMHSDKYTRMLLLLLLLSLNQLMPRNSSCTTPSAAAAAAATAAIAAPAAALRSCFWVGAVLGPSCPRLREGGKRAMKTSSSSDLAYFTQDKGGGFGVMHAHSAAQHMPSISTQAEALAPPSPPPPRTSWPRDAPADCQCLRGSPHRCATPARCLVVESCTRVHTNEPPRQYGTDTGIPAWPCRVEACNGI